MINEIKDERVKVADAAKILGLTVEVLRYMISTKVINIGYSYPSIRSQKNTPERGVQTRTTYYISKNKLNNYLNGGIINGEKI